MKKNYYTPDWTKFLDSQTKKSILNKCYESLVDKCVIFVFCYYLKIILIKDLFSLSDNLPLKQILLIFYTELSKRLTSLQCFKLLYLKSLHNELVQIICYSDFDKYAFENILYVSPCV